MFIRSSNVILSIFFGISATFGNVEVVNSFQKKTNQENYFISKNNFRIVCQNSKKRKQNNTRIIRNRHFSVTRSLDDEVLNQLAKEKFGGDRLWAAQWAVSHPKKYHEYILRYIERATQR